MPPLLGLGFFLLLSGHSGQPADAPFVGNRCLPAGLSQVELTWVDQDTPTPVGSATVSLYRTQEQPATFTLGTVPLDLQGELIHSALEEDPDNRFVWDLSNVPAGRWFVYSRVIEPPGQPGDVSPEHVRFLPSVISTGDETDRPTVFVARPANEFAVTAAGQYRIEYCVTGATPVAKVYLEAQPRSGGALTVIAADLPASGEHSFTWATDGLPRGDWRLRATVQDCEGRRFSAWAPYFVFVAGEGNDAGVVEVENPDAGWQVCPQLTDAGEVDVRQTRDTGPSDARQPLPSADGCGCRQTSSPGRCLILMLSVIALRLRTGGRHHRAVADPRSELRVLLVDDDAVDAEGVVRAFKKTNITHPVVRAMDGVEALQILRGEGESPKLTKPYLVLLDLNMPRMSGVEFLREVRKDPELKDTIVFVLTTSQADADKIAVYDLNVAGYLVKDEVGRDYQALTGLLRHYWEVVEFPPANEV